MDIILCNLKIKLSLSEEIFNLLLSIIQTENNNIIFQNYEKLLSFNLIYNNSIIQLENNSEKFEKERYNYYFILLTLYNFNLHRDFKNPLLTILKSTKNFPLILQDTSLKKSLFEKIIEDYFEIFNLNNERENIYFLRTKLLSFINYFDLLKNFNIFETEKIKFNYYNGFKSILREIEFHLEKINDDVFQMLIMFFKYLNTFYKNNPFYIIDNEIVDLVYKQLFMNYENLNQIQLCKDYEFNLANCYFQIIYLKLKKIYPDQNSIKQIKDYINKGKALFEKFEKDVFRVMLYFKAFIVNIDNEKYLFECLKMNKNQEENQEENKEENQEENQEENLSNFEFLKFIQENYFIKNRNKENIRNINVINNKKNLNFLEFFNLFLCSDLKLNLTSLINEIFLSIVIKSNIKNYDFNSIEKTENIKTLVFNFISKEKIVQKILNKMQKDKNYFNIMDDFYYFILEAFYPNSIIKLDIEKLCFEYLKTIIEKNNKLMIIEVKIFKFLNFQEYQNLKLIKEFFQFIFQKKFEKKNLPLINEYIKVLCEFFFKNSELLENQRKLDNITKNKEIDQNTLVSGYKILEEKYNKFLEVFCEPFFCYLQKIEGKSLKHLKNIFVNLEKFNKNLYILIVYEFHKKYFINIKEKNYENLTKNYLIFFTLIKPFKNHKKSIKIILEEDDEKRIYFSFEIFKHYKDINFSLDINEIKNLIKSLDRYLVINILEFLVGMENEENVFEIIYSLIKYNLKTSYVEFKSSVMKTFNVYFTGYIQKINRLLNSEEKNLIKKKERKNNEFLKPNEIFLLDKSLINFTKLLRFLTENIYDKPVENLLCFLEILKLIISNFDINFEILTNYYKKDSNINNNFIEEKDKFYYKNNFKIIFDKYIFNKGFCFSLISLLRQSWSLVRSNSFSILKCKFFKNLIVKNKEILLEEILINVNSLRQMDAEGSVNLFLLMNHHLKSEFLQYFFKNLFLRNSLDMDYRENKDSVLNNNFDFLKEALVQFMSIVNSKTGSYLNHINSDVKINSFNSNFYIHSYFIFIKNTLQEIKLSPESFFNINLKHTDENENNNKLYEFTLLLNNLTELILNLNSKFKLILVNNGVSEFNMSGEGENEMFESEDKRLISLWICSKFSLESLTLCYEIIHNFYKILQKNLKFENLLKNIKRNVTTIIDLMIDYKHMGAICGLNESLLSACRLVKIIFNYHNIFFCDKIFII